MTKEITKWGAIVAILTVLMGTAYSLGSAMAEQRADTQVLQEQMEVRMERERVMEQVVTKLTFIVGRLEASSQNKPPGH